ncbi:hypothetical protein Q6240_28450, partial [Klebsiella pneumoniae]|nr:hypothetical protein [Klebsiella pneumoniae]
MTRLPFSDASGDQRMRQSVGPAVKAGKIQAVFALDHCRVRRCLLEANRQLLTGRLEVAADGPHLVMPMIASLRARYPGITVNLRLGNA